MTNAHDIEKRQHYTEIEAQCTKCLLHNAKLMIPVLRPSSTFQVPVDPWPPCKPPFCQSNATPSAP